MRKSRQCIITSFLENKSIFSYHLSNTSHQSDIPCRDTSASCKVRLLVVCQDILKLTIPRSFGMHITTINWSAVISVSNKPTSPLMRSDKAWIPKVCEFTPITLEYYSTISPSQLLFDLKPDISRMGQMDYCIQTI